MSAAVNESRTLLVMAGGTGGHVFPGLAVADHLRADGWNVVWMGNPDGMEAKLVPARGYELAPVRFGALRGKGLLRKLLLPLALLSGFWQAARQIRRVQPDVVLGMGGYISFPGGMMAALLGRPLALHEQNSVAGLANRVLAKVADRILSGFPDVLGDGIWAGNPVRAEIAALPAPAARYATHDGPIRVLVLGGSLGAAALNEMVPKGLALIPAEERPTVVHQSGEKHLAALQANYAAAGVQAHCVAFIEDMAGAYEWADLVICRAGALTVAELAAAGVASILVPFPHAVDDHQTGNAKFLANAGGAILLPQSDLTPEKVALIRNYGREQLLQMAERARELAKPDATAIVAQACAELVK
ncbi:undecaprenyldiphospho-muramoylpentapeptide beta-N-acetylglucosaminyltransferase [Azospira restricta]|uniref:UDP-N-acetylglucosamine--N-acetylmuramyl-(pentapeptide) pyrophosphoryl-undecaprenol N-acetylglucosamine transferase n=1 Tax=Azospira restricta TaxID=404405 RepID=A0A974SNW8_9RHOO|nr:undecaprenyldiphospho-muramoylpentapeptide beta-N-acetylglucosaminyltransferase [Azospira restricta]QRJ63729.1 undecaprenyldiphospho-muramoylpentapeptide beta-N-acetylglucosaminyltransferase [Azospira restricta]